MQLINYLKMVNGINWHKLLWSWKLKVKEKRAFI